MTSHASKHGGQATCCVEVPCFVVGLPPRFFLQAPRDGGRRSLGLHMSHSSSRPRKSRKKPRGKRGRAFDRPDLDSSPLSSHPPPLPRGPPPVVRHGNSGWIEDPVESAKDDEFWHLFREAEMKVRGPHAEIGESRIRDVRPTGRDGKPVEYPAAAVFDEEVGGFRPTTLEEENSLRCSGEYDPYYVEEWSVKSGPRPKTWVQHTSSPGDDNWVSVNPGRDSGTTEGTTDSGKPGTDGKVVIPPFSSLAVRFLTGNGAATLALPQGPDANFSDPGASEEQHMSNLVIHERQSSDKPKMYRRPLDLAPGAWRVVNLGTSSAVPTRKRNVSCTAFLASPPSPSSSDGSIHAPGQTSADHREPTMFLVDAGENASARLESAYWSMTHGFRWIRAIFITHLHGDHIYGLPSLLQSIGRYAQYRRRKAVEAGEDGSDPVIRIFGPYGTRGFVRTSLYWTPPLGVRFSIAELIPRQTDFRHLRGSGNRLVGTKDTHHGMETEEVPDFSRDTPPPHPEEVRVEDVEADCDGMWRVWNDDDGSGVYVCAAPLVHRVPCFGYVFTEKNDSVPERFRSTHFASVESDADAEAEDVVIDTIRARSLGVRGRQYGVLRSGRSVTIKSSGLVVTPEDVGIRGSRVGERPDGAFNADLVGRYRQSTRKVVLLGDTCDSSAIAEASKGADLLLHEATFTNALADKAKLAMHSTARMAGAFAKEVEARRLVLSHFSSRYEAVQLAALISESDDVVAVESDASDTKSAFDVSGTPGADFEDDLEDDVDDDLTNPNVLIREAGEAFGDEGEIVAAHDFMEHTIFRPWHGDSDWQSRTLRREQGV